MVHLQGLPYPIVVAPDIAPIIAAFVRQRKPQRTIVLCDRNIEQRAQRIAHQIDGSVVVPFALGETRKTLRTLEHVLRAMVAMNADRSSLVLGVGGGVAGDVFGFAAAVYMRGVTFAPVATSLVAMCDAAVGSKVGVDLVEGKNLAGAFRDPVAVFADVGALATLPSGALRDGLGEIVKHSLLDSDAALSELEALSARPFARWPWEDLVTKSLRIKTKIVAVDRLERGARQKLNLGHTFAHAIEHVSGYRVSHGAAVAIGLRAAGLMALETGRYSKGEHRRVLSLLAGFRLPIVSPVTDIGSLVKAMCTDKKVHDGACRFVLPRAIGDVEYGVAVPIETVRSVVRRIGSDPDNHEI